MVMIQIDLVNIQELTSILATAGAEAPNLLASALVEEANVAFRKSQLEVPFRTGVLKGSGRVSVPEIHNGEVTVDISYGGAARAYAYIMHQGIMNGRPINYRNGKKAFYLQDPVEAITPLLAERLTARVEAILNARA